MEKRKSDLEKTGDRLKIAESLMTKIIKDLNVEVVKQGNQN